MITGFFIIDVSGNVFLACSAQAVEAPSFRTELRIELVSGSHVSIADVWREKPEGLKPILDFIAQRLKSGDRIIDLRDEFVSQPDLEMPNFWNVVPKGQATSDPGPAPHS